MVGVGVLGLPLVWLMASAQPPADAAKGVDRPRAEASKPKGGEADAAVSAANADKDKRCDARCLLSQFAGLDGATPLGETLKRIQFLGYESVDFVVLLAPDPKDSAFSESFDSYISAAKIAVEAADYSSDRVFDPWHAEAPSADGGGAKPTESRPLYRDLPGALLFRRDVKDVKDVKGVGGAGGAMGEAGRHRELLVLLVVGETPTWGIQQKAFTNALDLVRDTCASAALLHMDGVCPLSGKEKEAFALRILGPSSSGAAESLRIGLTSWIEGNGGPATFARPPWRIEPWRIEMISGSASSRDNQRILQTELATRLAPIAFKFSATVRADDRLWNVVSGYLSDMGARPDQIALLIESNTDYGQDFKIEAAKVDPTKSEAKRDAVLNLPFPLHIAEARPHPRDTATGAADPVVLPTTIRDLYLSRGSAGPRSLSIDDQLTRSANERALTNILRTISSQDRRFVGILASDVLDTMFLAQQVRTWFPDVIVVVFTSDLLYLDDAVPFMDGVLVASTYPLADWTQQASFPFSGDRIRHMFPNEYAQGVYNAMLSLLEDKRPDDLTDPRDLADYGRPFSHPCTDRPPGTPCGLVVPPVWMSVVSQGAFWPLEARECKPDDHDVYTLRLKPLETNPDDKDRVAAWRLPPESGLGIFSVVFAVFAILTGVAYWRGLRIAEDANDQIYPPGQLLLRSAGFRHPRLHRFGRVSLFLLFALLGTVLLPFVCLEARLAWDGGETGDRVVSIATLGLLALAQFVICGLLLLSTWRCLRKEDEPLAEGTEVVVPAILALLMVGAGLWFLFSSFAGLRIGEFNPGDGAVRLVFLYFRERALSGGQSLIALSAMLAVAYLVWICGHLRMVRIHQSAKPLRDVKLLSSARGDEDKEGRDTSALLDQLGIQRLCNAAVTQAEKVNPTIAVRVVMAAFYLVVVTLVVPRLQFFEKTLPWGGVARFFPFAYVAIVGFLFWGCYSFVATWVALRRVLLVLVAHPIATAFRRIPPRLADVFRHPWSTAVKTVWDNHLIVLFNSAKALSAKMAADAVAANAANAANVATTGSIVARWIRTLSPATASSSMPDWLFETGATRDLEGFILALGSHELKIAKALYEGEPKRPSGIAVKPEDFEKLEAVSSVSLMRAGLPDDQQLWIRLWEEFLVLRLVAVIGYVRAQIYNVIGTVSIASVPILLVTTLYPFQGSRTFLLLVVALVAAVVATALTVFTQMNRNPVMSMIEGTAPGVVTWDRSYVMGLILHGAIPIATLVSVKFPAAGRSLRSVVDFLVRMANH